MKAMEQLYRINFIHTSFYGYVQHALDCGSDQSIKDLAKQFVDSQKLSIGYETVVRTYYDTLEIGRQIKKTR